MVSKKRKSEGYSFRVNKVALVEGVNLSAEEKLIWLRNANRFVSNFVSPKMLAVWDQYIKKGTSDQ